MKNVNRTVILALILLCVAIVFLTIRNDVRSNKERNEEVRQKDIQDSTARSQADDLTAILNNVKDQLGSIRNVQCENNDMMKRDIDSIKSSLELITRTKQQRLKTKK